MCNKLIDSILWWCIFDCIYRKQGINKMSTKAQIINYLKDKEAFYYNAYHISHNRDDVIKGNIATDCLQVVTEMLDGMKIVEDTES